MKSTNKLVQDTLQGTEHKSQLFSLRNIQNVLMPVAARCEA
jgi:hypothetical protein